MTSRVNGSLAAFGMRGRRWGWLINVLGLDVAMKLRVAKGQSILCRVNDRCNL